MQSFKKREKRKAISYSYLPGGKAPHSFLPLWKWEKEINLEGERRAELTDKAS